MSRHQVSFEANINITVGERRGWFYGQSDSGIKANSNTEMDCVRKIKDASIERLRGYAKVKK